MLKTLWNGRSGLSSNQNRMDAISNNIANVNTTGYKRIDVSFKELVYQEIGGDGIPKTSNNKELIGGNGAKADILVRNMQNGVFLQTNSDSDMAIEGNGYFRLIKRDPLGNTEYLYTRDGAFKFSRHPDGDNKLCLVHSSGYLLDIEDFKAEEFKKPIIINPEGEIYSDNKLVGKIKIFDFINKDDMQDVGGNLFRAEGGIISNSSIRQGYIENSNVDISKELTDMMITQRAFELNSKSVKNGDEMWQVTNNLRSK